jgi:hypothetical protein
MVICEPVEGDHRLEALVLHGVKDYDFVGAAQNEEIVAFLVLFQCAAWGDEVFLDEFVGSENSSIRSSSGVELTDLSIHFVVE